MAAPDLLFLRDLAGRTSIRMHACRRFSGCSSRPDPLFRPCADVEPPRDRYKHYDQEDIYKLVPKPQWTGCAPRPQSRLHARLCACGAGAKWAGAHSTIPHSQARG